MILTTRLVVKGKYKTKCFLAIKKSPGNLPKGNLIRCAKRIKQPKRITAMPITINNFPIVFMLVVSRKFSITVWKVENILQGRKNFFQF